MQKTIPSLSSMWLDFTPTTQVRWILSKALIVCAILLIVRFLIFNFVM